MPPRIEPEPPPYRPEPAPGSAPSPFEVDAGRGYLAAALTDLANGARHRGVPPPAIVSGTVDALAGMVVAFFSEEQIDSAAAWIAEMVRDQAKERYRRAN